MTYFDIIQYFENKGIDYKKSGKNIGKFIGIKDCPFCGDSSYHLGYDQQRSFFSCWKCGSHDVRSFLYKIEKNWHKVNQILENYKLDIDKIVFLKEEKEIYRSQNYKLPIDFTDKFPTSMKEYLKFRKFDYLYLKKYYNIYYSGDIGRARYRIVWPCYENGIIVNFIARDITGEQIIPYIFDLDENAKVKRKDLLFNLDSVKKGGTIILTEGVLDACRIGDGAVAMLSVNFSKGQLIKIKNKSIKKAYLMFDNDPAGEKMSKKLESYLTFIPEVNYIEYPSKDPASLDLDLVKELRRLIL